MGTWLEPLVFGRQSTNLHTPGLVNEDRQQPESKLIVSFTLSSFCFPPQRRQAMGWQRAELARLCPEGIASLKTVYHVRKGCLFSLSECPPTFDSVDWEGPLSCTVG